MLKVINVVGARPNFMKVAPIVEAMRRRVREFAPLVVHTGQHYDTQMSEAFFRDLALPEPDVYLGVGSGTHAAQTAAVLERFEPVVVRERPDWVLVVGDVNSTLACALCCSKLGVRVAHVEAGLRSRDRAMPEEINRLLTDQLADLLLTPSPDADANLLAEGIAPARIRFVGNVMIDSLRAQLERARSSDARARLGVSDKDYAVVTLHRPSNVDERTTVGRILCALEQVGEHLPVIFPAHPRTRQKLLEFGFVEESGGEDGLRLVRRTGESDGQFGESQPVGRGGGLRLVEPLGYLDFLGLMSGARLVLTDSGGIQEETTALAIPCLTLRENTERPVTVELGTNTLVGTDGARILSAALAHLERPRTPLEQTRLPPLWDGHAAERILDALQAASKTNG